MIASGLLPVEDGKRWLLAIAAEIEAAAIAGARGVQVPAGYWSRAALGPALDLVVTGVGKANAAGGTAHVLDPARHCGVISLGIGGSLADGAGAHTPLRSVVVGSASVFADEGIERDAGWETVAALGFPPSAGLSGEHAMGAHCSPALIAQLAPLSPRVGPIATVSTCSATDASAAAVRARTGAIAEAMEGAAVGLAARRLWQAAGLAEPAPFVEVRVISNATGSQGGAWDLEGALARLGEVAQVL